MLKDIIIIELPPERKKKSLSSVQTKLGSVSPLRVLIDILMDMLNCFCTMLYVRSISRSSGDILILKDLIMPSASASCMLILKDLSKASESSPDCILILKALNRASGDSISCI